MIRAGTVATENVTHFGQVDRAIFSITEHAPSEGWVVLAFSNAENEGESSVMLVPREAFGRAAAAFLGVEQ